MKRITIQTEFAAEVPDDTNAETIQAITLEIPFEQIRIDDGGLGPLAGAKITGYTTTAVFDDQEEKE